ncbi:DUF6228 family protein [Micromonospora sp. GCM10011542]|uniref:DUF6228 family protein n=1 Tax=Micromonospora sp. GCM10011542 TaxID=3317337 RepID=UPI00361C2811
MTIVVAVQLGARGEWLRLTPDNTSHRPPQYVTAELRCDGLAASRQVVHNYASGFEDLADFFGQLADDWRGWSGERVWESVEGDLRIEARHEYRHIQLRIVIRSPGPGWGNEGWKAAADLTIDPGEELTRAVSDLRVLALGTASDDDPV